MHKAPPPKRNEAKPARGMQAARNRLERHARAMEEEPRRPAPRTAVMKKSGGSKKPAAKSSLAKPTKKPAPMGVPARGTMDDLSVTRVKR